jgi:hypothetical protein
MFMTYQHTGPPPPPEGLIDKQTFMVNADSKQKINTIITETLVEERSNGRCKNDLSIGDDADAYLYKGQREKAF